MQTVALSVFWFAIIWTFNDIFPRPFDDFKNTILYVGAGLLILTTRKQPSGDRARLAIAGYFILCIISIVLSPTAKYEGLLELARLILWAGLTWLFAQLTPQQWRWLMRLTVLSAATIGALTWYQATGHTPWPFAPPFYAPIGHATYYSDFMALALVMAMGLLSTGTGYLLRKTPNRYRLPVGVWLTCMVLIDIGLALAAKRASLVGLAAAFLLALPLIAWLRRSFKPVIWLAVIGALHLAVIFSFTIPSQGATVMERFQSVIEAPIPTTPAPGAPQTATPFEQATSGRWHAYLTSLHIALQRPLAGWGLGTFRFVYPEFAHRKGDDPLITRSMWYMHPHNEVLHQAVELGLPGAFLFLLGFGYLLYRGIRKLRGQTPEAQVFGITALCGLTVAFVSWQLSTNFLFPVSRLVTTLCVGMILSSTGTGYLLGKKRNRYPVPVGIIVTSIATLFIGAYQLSLYCVQKEQGARNLGKARYYADWATRLAPGAFDPLYVRAITALNTGSPAEAASAVDTLYAHYPYVPVVLHMTGVLRAQQGRFAEARSLLEHALQNDPTNNAAGELLRQISPPEMP